MTKSQRFAILRNSITLAVLMLCTFAAAHAQTGNGSSGGSVPEIDPSMLGGGVSLLGGAVMLFRAARKR